MMLKKFVCVGSTLQFRLAVPPVTGNITINPEIFPANPASASVLSNKIKNGGNKVYIKLGFTITGATNGSCVQTNPVYGIIEGTATKVKIDSGKKPVRENDSVLVTIVGNIGTTPSSFSATVEILMPGQDKAKGE